MIISVLMAKYSEQYHVRVLCPQGKSSLFSLDRIQCYSGHSDKDAAVDNRIPMFYTEQNRITYRHLRSAEFLEERLAS
jgi:hypothetical protein